jgi:hypothetical protein
MIIPYDNLPLSPRTHSLASFERDEAPPSHVKLYVLSEDDRGEYQIPFPVMLTDDSAMNANTWQELADEVGIVGWRVA